MKESLLLTPREMIGVSTEPEQKRFFLNPASQNKSVEYKRSLAALQSRTSTWLAPYREKSLLTRLFNNPAPRGCHDCPNAKLGFLGSS
jgi:hypothetical protein